jgi:hypothetical protein
MSRGDKLITQIDSYINELYRVDERGQIVPADPAKLATNLLLMRGALTRLVDVVYEADLDYRQTKAARFDRFIKEGMKKSPAFDQLEMEQDLIEKKIATERLKNYMKFAEGLCTSVQSVLKYEQATNI